MSINQIGSTLLNAVTTTQTSNPLPMKGGRSQHSIQVVITGAPTACEVDLLGSLDGTNFGKIATWSLANGNVSGDILTVDAANVIAVEAQLLTLTGGTTPTVTVIYSGQI